jgi:hypothetical protein
VGFQQELMRVEGQKRDAEAAMASLTVDVANHRAAHANLEGTVLRLQNEAIGKRLAW